MAVVGGSRHRSRQHPLEGGRSFWRSEPAATSSGQQPIRCYQKELGLSTGARGSAISNLGMLDIAYHLRLGPVHPSIACVVINATQVVRYNLNRRACESLWAPPPHFTVDTFPLKSSFYKLIYKKTVNCRFPSASTVANGGVTSNLARPATPE